MVSQKIDLATPLSNANSSIVSITYNIGQPVIGKSSNGMIKKGFLYLVRSSTPTETLLVSRPISLEISTSAV